jgi:hypothetical protein
MPPDMPAFTLIFHFQPPHFQADSRRYATAIDSLAAISFIIADRAIG